MFRCYVGFSVVTVITCFFLQYGSLNGLKIGANDVFLTAKNVEDLKRLDDGGANVGKVCRPLCGCGMFSLTGAPTCQHWLNCTSIRLEIEILGEIGRGAVKKVSLGLWKTNLVAVSTPVTSFDGFVHFREDFESGLRSLIELSPSPHLVQLVGFCEDPLIVVTEFHQFGNAADALVLLRSDGFRLFDSSRLRFGMCLDYAEVLAWLHSRAGGPRVMCDSSSLAKTLEQYLMTDDWRLVLNDLDALPVANRSIKCGHRQLTGNFVAPEQLWPHVDWEYDDAAMSSYDEKTDIWKLPDVCGNFLQGTNDEEILVFHLFNLHRRCKAIDPTQRPTAQDVVEGYRIVWQSLYS